MNKFPEFHFDGNLYCGMVKSSEDLDNLFKCYEGHISREEILIRSTLKEYIFNTHFKTFSFNWNRNTITLSEHLSAYFRGLKINKILEDGNI